MMDRSQVIDACGRYWNPTAATFFHVTHRTIESHAEGCTVVDEEGRRYLDFACSYGVFVIGHCNPYVRRRVLEQMDRLASAPFGVANPVAAELMEVVTDMLPGGLNRVFFANSGAESSEMALRAALACNAPRRKVIAAINSYHGKTLGALNILGQQGHRSPFLPLMAEVEFVPYGDIEAMRRAVGDGVAAVFLEPILGGPFITVPPPGYLKEVESLCRRTQSLLVVDEVQTGFGRAGKMFAIEYDGVEPDIMLLSKGITGGHAAIALAVMQDSVVERLERIEGLPPRYLSSDSGGSPYACAAALASIEFIRDNQLPERAAFLGQRLRSGLERMARKYPKLILDVPGTGLMTGLRVRNPAVETAITMALGKRGVHVGHSMNETAPHPVLRFYPPLTVTEAEIDQSLEALEQALEGLGRIPGRVYDLLDVIVRRQYRIPRKWLLRLSGVKDGHAQAHA
ncbi:aspartate aminotransferase family protein [Vitiosangium sp. GDMCC 1.1324]|uniref:aspartate aminotransferase family protein n=1 Tax=Vitiosangium sp. (strain GDMCC 1.1324) TaxID=2138576 RepID=UPI000D3876D8|nr:aminotransferase class III-fold pyridoxal phosphate-dependent enzyme [Vitiosangium sp. GDMCC 1.1324]PTL76223.1 aspartate aminotransferase family protein [Vitiosangium sp. GDMCC 1.1324]